MKHRFQLLLIALFVSYSIVNAQKSSSISYAQKIYKAESSIIDSQYHEALSLYKDAFSDKSIPFAVDLYNAAVCATKLGKMETAVNLCGQLAYKGVGSDFLERQPEFLPLKEFQDWQDLCKKADQRKDEIATKSAQLRTTLDNMVTIDQDINHQWRASGTSGEMRRVMDSVNIVLSKQLINLFTEEGFIGEDKIGVTIDGDKIIESFPFDVIIIHNYQSRWNGNLGDTLFTAALTKALSDGLITPQYFAFIQDFAGQHHGKNYGSASTFLQYECNLYFDKFLVDSVSAIDQRRAEIGLFNLTDLRKRIVYNFTHPESGFMIIAPCPTIGSFADESSKNIFLKTQELVFENILGCRK